MRLGATHASPIELAILRHLTCLGSVLLSANRPVSAHIGYIRWSGMTVTVHVDIMQRILLCELQESTIRVHATVCNRR